MRASAMQSLGYHAVLGFRATMRNACQNGPVRPPEGHARCAARTRPPRRRSSGASSAHRRSPRYRRQHARVPRSAYNVTGAATTMRPWRRHAARAAANPHGRAQSRCRCGRGEPSPGADVAARQQQSQRQSARLTGEPSSGADVAGCAQSRQRPRFWYPSLSAGLARATPPRRDVRCARVACCTTHVWFRFRAGDACTTAACRTSRLDGLGSQPRRSCAARIYRSSSERCADSSRPVR
jgi:hypothetical protein